MSDLATELVPDETGRLLQAEQAVRDYCGWHISPSLTHTVTIRDQRGSRLMLPSLYVTAVASVTIDGTVADPATYDVNRNGWIEWRNTSPWWGYGCYGRVIVVEFTHGYVDPPATVTAAVQALAQNAIGNPSGLTRKTIGPFTEQYAAPGADQMSGLGLDAYRIVQVS